MTTQTTTESILTTAVVFSTAERRALHTLRRRYSQNHDLFSDRELAHLRFLRWLHSSERLLP